MYFLCAYNIKMSPLSPQRDVSFGCGWKKETPVMEG